MYETKYQFALEETGLGGYKRITLTAEKESHLKKYLKYRGYHFNKKIKRWIKGKLRKNITDEIQIIPLLHLTPEQFRQS